jgi:hypothetical protein
MDIMDYTNIDGYLFISASIVFVFFCTENVHYKINGFFSSKIKNRKAHSQAREINWN